METTKFLLKKDEQDKGVLCDKVTLKGFDYYVSDDEIKNEKHSLYEDLKGNLHLVGETIRQHNLQCKCILLNGTTFYEGYKRFRKAIATNNPNIDLPHVVDEVEVLAKNQNYDLYNSHDTWAYIGFKTGYNKSQSTHPNSDEDMIGFGKFCGDYGSQLNKDSNIWLNHFVNQEKTTQELLQIWKSQQPKVIYYQ